MGPAANSITYQWTDQLEALASEFLDKYFGANRDASWIGLSRDEYPWSNTEIRVGDSRIHAKNNEEYHGMERHAWQYHVTEQYAEAYHHFLMAASWRRTDRELLDAWDEAHEEAIQFCIRHALYNRDLETARRNLWPWPQQTDYGINPTAHAKSEAKAEAQLDAFQHKNGTSTLKREARNQ